MNLNNLTIKYWNIFYKKKKLVSKPTKFSIFCLKFLKSYKGILFDLGCGNGRDTIFFNKNKINAMGLDVSSSAIKNNKKRYKAIKNKFKKGNFCLTFNKKKIKEKFSIYSRFTLHTINHENEKKLIKSLINQKNLEYLFIETRTIQDEFFGVGKKIGRNEYISNHYRRFIVPSELKKTLSKNFKIIYFKQSKSFAKFKSYKPNVLRVIAKKNNF